MGVRLLGRAGRLGSLHWGAALAVREGSDDNSSMSTSAPSPPAPSAGLDPRLRLAASGLLVALILLCLAWELVFAPLRPGGSWLVLKAVPLLAPLRGVLRGRVYTYQWAAMLALLYVMEGAVRAMSDANPVSASLAWVELLLAGSFFACAVMYVRPAKLAAKREAKRAAKPAGRG